MKKIRYTIKQINGLDYILINKGNMDICGEIFWFGPFDENDLYKWFAVDVNELKKIKEKINSHNKLIDDQKFNKKFKELLNE